MTASPEAAPEPDADQSAPMIAAETVSASFGSVSVLSAVDLTVDHGTFLGVVGPNGAGKTTLLRTLRGTQTLDRGAIRVAGQSLQELSAQQASQLVASVPQSTTLSFDFTVRQTVEMGRTPHLRRFGSLDSQDRGVIQAAMERTNVSQFADRSITDVSGGERQRVLLARALAQETPVLLLDEPTASLDVNHAVQTLELVRELVAEGKTVVAAIHDLNLAARYCDELAVLAEGQKRVSGPPGEVLTAETIEATFGGEPLVTTQPATDAPLVTVLSEQEAAETHVHLVGTGTYAARAIEGLLTEGFTVSTGVLPTVDVAAERARKLDCRVVTVPAFAGIDEQAQERASELAREADAVVVVGEIHPENQAVVDAGRQVFEIGAADPGAVDADSLTSGGGLAGVPERIAKTDLKDN